MQLAHLGELEDVTDACVGGTASEAFLPCKGHAVVRQNGMYAIREGQQHLSKELRCGICDAVYGDKHVLFAAGDLRFGAVDVNEAEHRLFKFSAPSWHMRCGLSADPVTLQASKRSSRCRPTPEYFTALVARAAM